MIRRMQDPIWQKHEGLKGVHVIVLYMRIKYKTYTSQMQLHSQLCFAWRSLIEKQIKSSLLFV